MCLRKMDINPLFNSRAICKSIHVNECNRYALHFLNYQLISISETATEESAVSALERSVSLTTFNEDDCVFSVSFTGVCASAC